MMHKKVERVVFIIVSFTSQGCVER